MRRREGEEEEEEWEILGCALRDFVVVGKVVPLLSDWIFLILNSFASHIHISYSIHVLNPHPLSLPLQFD